MTWGLGVKREVDEWGKSKRGGGENWILLSYVVQCEEEMW